MSDPLSLIAVSALSGAIGGGAGKFVEKAWDSGEKWVVSYFAEWPLWAYCRPLSLTFQSTSIAPQTLKNQRSSSGMLLLSYLLHPKTQGLLPLYQ